MINVIVLNENILYLIAVAIVGIVGWVLAYTEFEGKKKLEVKSRESIEKLISEQTRDKESLWKGHIIEVETLKKSFEALDKDHIIEVESLKKSFEALAKETEIANEKELKEIEELITNRISDIEAVYKETIEDQNASLELYEKYIKNFDAALTLSDKKLKEVDVRGSFETDDEVGFFFQNVKALQEALNKFKIDKEVLDSEQSEKLKN